MTNAEVSYFLPPQWNFHLGGPLSLGNIIYDPKAPQFAINDEDRLPLPKLFIDDEKPMFKATLAEGRANSVGIGSSLLQLFSISADLKVERSKTRIWTIEAEKLHVQEINPKPSWVEDCFQQSEVQNELKRTKYRKDVYMVTGIMAGSNATVSCELGKWWLVEGKLGVNVAAVTGGVPADVHAEGSRSVKRTTEASFGKSSFILAYKISKIIYTKTLSVKKIEQIKGESSGALLHGGRRTDTLARDDEEDDSMEAVILGIEDGTVGADEFGLASVEGQIGDGGSGDIAVEFVLPVDPSDAE